MNSVYDYGQRTWVTEVICLKDYFSKFVKVLPDLEASVTGKTGRWKEKVENPAKIKKLMNVKLSEDEFTILSESCNLNKLTVPNEPPIVDVSCIKRRPGLFDKSNISDSAKELETMKHLQKRILNAEAVSHLKYRSSIWPGCHLCATPDLEVGKHMLISVRIYHPFRHRLGIRIVNPPRCSQEMVVLGNQTISVLRDTIVCASDLCVPGEVSNNPNQDFKKKAKDIYKSGFIFIENTFYNDFRDPKNIDYSAVIRKWGEGRDLGPFKTEEMDKVKFEDLSLRLGYPYVYQHQGNCEHLISFSDVRLLHKSDNLSSQNYPLIRSMSTSNAQYCMICGMYMAKWITTENERVPHDPCYFCDHCFCSYNYIDGKKIGNFKAYPFS
ncbi:hypothetical protein L9F63_000751, partial [Diploptera punctata]